MSEDLMDRREFGKQLAKNLAGLFVASYIPKIENKENNFFDNVGFKEIQHLENIELPLHNKPGIPVILMNYHLGKDKIGFRLHGEQEACISFVDGQEIKRTKGEIIDPTIYKVTRTYEGRVGVYPTLDGNFDTSEGSGDLPDRIVSAIKVTVRSRNYFPDGGDNPEEFNPKNGDKFGEGYIIGDLEEKPTGYHFSTLGFVCDARALKIVS